MAVMRRRALKEDLGGDLGGDLRKVNLWMILYRLYQANNASAGQADGDNNMGSSAK